MGYAVAVLSETEAYQINYTEDTQGRVFRGEVDFLNAIPRPLSEVISVFIFSNAGMGGIHYLPVFEFPLLLVAPKALLVQKKTASSLGMTISVSDFFMRSFSCLC
jgi:hypothetical protein